MYERFHGWLELHQLASEYRDNLIPGLCDLLSNAMAEAMPPVNVANIGDYLTLPQHQSELNSSFNPQIFEQDNRSTLSGLDHKMPG